MANSRTRAGTRGVMRGPEGRGISVLRFRTWRCRLSNIFSSEVLIAASVTGEESCICGEIICWCFNQTGNKHAHTFTRTHCSCFTHRTECSILREESSLKCEDSEYTDPSVLSRQQTGLWDCSFRKLLIPPICLGRLVFWLLHFLFPCLQAGVFCSGKSNWNR